jgi:two-component system, cell cycle response regulator
VESRVPRLPDRNDSGANAAAAQEVTAAAAENAPPRRRVLIVDDSSSVRAALRAALLELPAIDEIVEAVDGVDALALLARTSVDLILTDITMPRLDGFKFLAAVRDSPRFRDVMVIMLSAHGESVDKVRGLTLGANDYVTKPFERAELLARVTTMLKMKGLQEELQQKATALVRVNLELERLANQDWLTGLPNRRSLFTRLEIEFHRSRRFKNSLTLLMLDIDHFKAFNDAYGHQSGDEALRVVGDALAGAIRGYDCIGRYGGEEFICFLPETVPAEALVVAERLRQRVSAARVTVAGRDGVSSEVGMTVSIGIATWPDCPAERVDDLVAVADRALYQAKSEGRNRCMFAALLQQPDGTVPGDASC